MSETIKKIGVMTSGGDAPGMNAAIRAVARASFYHKIEVYGIIQGYKGLINGDFIPLGFRDVGNIIHRGGTILKTARCEEFKTPEGRKKAYKNFNKEGLDALVVIGGDGSFTGAKLFGQEYDVPIVGIPATIDNDIYGTNFTIGYDTALNTAVEAMDKIRDTASSHDRLFFVEVMGRNSGFIALNSGVAAGALYIALPEKESDSKSVPKLIYNAIKERKKSKRTSSIIVVAEGEKAGIRLDEIVRYVEKEIDKDHPGEENIYDIKKTILGHIQRGGSPSCMDRVLASKMGVKALNMLREGKRNVMVAIENHQLIEVSFEKAIHKVDKKVNENLLEIARVLSL